METSVQVMFWVLFARDNVDKPQSEVHSAVAAAKIEQNLNSLVLNLFQLLFLLFFVSAEESAFKPKIHTHRKTLQKYIQNYMYSRD